MTDQLKSKHNNHNQLSPSIHMALWTSKQNKTKQSKWIRKVFFFFVEMSFVVGKSAVHLCIFSSFSSFPRPIIKTIILRHTRSRCCSTRTGIWILDTKSINCKKKKNENSLVASLSSHPTSDRNRGQHKKISCTRQRWIDSHIRLWWPSLTKLVQ